MAMIKHAFLLATTVAMVFGQRPFFAGHRPIGYPELSTPSTTVATDELGNRFGEGDNSTSTTTQRLPIEANGDRDLIDRLSKLPMDNQPFWFINWQAIEANRKKPQTYPQRPSHFAGSNNFQPQDVADFNLNGDSGFSSETTTQKGSGNRDVDVSSFLANNNGVLGSPNASSTSNNAGITSPNPINNDLNSAANDDTLGNRNAFPDVQNTNPTSTPVSPTQNVLFTSSPVPSPIPSQASLNPSLNYGQVVSSFQSVPFSYRPSSGQKQVATSSTPPRIVNGILTDDPDYPYPILDPKTRDPALVNRMGPSVNNVPFRRSMFRDYEFGEQRPILSPYAILPSFYY